MNLREEINKLKDEGYSQQNAQARICQDIILEAISKCHLNENVTIKGGVVMRNISNDVRRATVDLDFDFIKKSISDDSIKLFVNQLNTVSDVTITIIGKIEELKQQDYKGKRVHISISDGNGLALTSKMDIGVHKDLDITQEEYCFDICFQDDGARLEVAFGYNHPSSAVVVALVYGLLYGLCAESGGVGNGTIMGYDIVFCLCRDRAGQTESYQ